ncbi:TIR domain-containing protein [Filimonas effusa]|uniref:TIR domain-containing protein n=1 Tax=Filimonas effusa TaxID=2508721 RepID=A0A4Q1DCM2_9BACT|nr:effector-associated domain EAD1-containing protein [Filimonas effusa]RXK86383.1 TIR domain-containing protein [Filimonas effusa]
MRLFSKYYNELLQEMYTRYPTREDISTLVKSAEIEPGDVNLNGSALVMCNSALTVAEQQNKLLPLIEAVLREHPNLSTVKEILERIKDGSAMIHPLQYTHNKAQQYVDSKKVFLVYDDTNKDMVLLLKKHLAPLYRFSKKISLFDIHTDLGGGANREEILSRNLENASIVLLLLTPDFWGNINNDCDKMMFAALEMRKCTIPVLLIDCLWTRIEALENIVPLPKDGQFVSSSANKDQLLKKIAEGIEEVVNSNCNQN